MTLRRTSLVVLLGVIMTMLDSTIVNVALTALARDYDTSLTTIQWVVTAYLLALSLTVPITAWAIGRFGARAVWLVSLVLFAGGSALCAASWSVGSLIAFRVIQGLGGGLLMPVGQSMLAMAAGKERMGTAMAWISIPSMLAPVLGPLLGGVIVDALDWRWMFLVNLPISAAALVAALTLLPRSPAPGPRARLDATGLALLSPGLALLMYGGPPAVAGAALMACFAVRAVRTAQPLLDLRLFADRTFSSAVVALVCYSAAVLGVTVLVPLYAQLARGGDALDAGLLLAPMGAGAALTMAPAGRLTDRTGPRGVGTAGILLAALGIVILVVSDAPYVAMFVLGLGHGMVAPSLSAAAYRTLDQGAIPSATTLMSIAVRAAGPFGVAGLTAVLQAATFTVTFWSALALVAIALAPVLLLPRARAYD
ncbi:MULTISPECIES: MFS transporter [Nonomuraea]|uniref:MFS transporter n=1 Tax=Nonomuraea mangrovi TaxID=2316207 RepID=A0ABW4TBG6_9ACTN